MKIDDTMRERAIVKELASRVKQSRIMEGMTQEQMSEKSMVSVGTIRRFEKGEDIGLTNFVRILEVIGYGTRFDLLVDDPEERPLYHIAKIKKRSRASRPKKEKQTTWKWGEDI